MFPSGLVGLRVAVAAAADGFDPRLVGLDDAVAALGHWTAIGNAAAAACALAAARVQAWGPPPASGAHSAEDYIAKATGTTTAKAKQRIRTGQALTDADATRAAATSGRLSPEQADAIADAVAVDPAAEGALLGLAVRGSLSDLRDGCARRKAAADPDPDATNARIHARRALRRYRDAEGAEHLHASGTREQMARVDQALKPYIDRVFDTARCGDTREPFEALAFDALAAMADAATNGSGRPAVSAKTAIRHLSVLRVDLEALVRGTVTGEETCEIAGLGPIPVRSARGLLGESILELVVTRGVDVRNVTHLGRGASTAQHIALLWEQPVCSREGCGRKARLELDHRDDWAACTAPTSTTSTRLCRPDHDLKTHAGWALTNGTGTRPMVPPNDPRHPHFHQHNTSEPRAG